MKIEKLEVKKLYGKYDYDLVNLGACHNEQSVNICSRWLTGIFF